MINSSVSGLFASLNKDSSTSGIYNNLSEYSNIKSGSFFKLAKKYYAGDTSPHIKGDSVVNKTTSISKENTSKLASIESGAKELKSSSEKLIETGKDSLFKQTDGEYDTDKIYEAVNSFVKDYNNILDKTEKTNSDNILSNVDSLKKTTTANSKALDKIGISIDTDGKLSVDKEKFDKADMNSVKSLFNGRGSYAYQTTVSASMIDFSAKNEMTKANTYTDGGAYSYNFNSGDIYNQIV